VKSIAAVERNRVGGDNFTREVACSLYKLLAYKDEYEVARLYTNGEFEAKVKAQFDGEVSLQFHLAPPLFAKRDKNGHLIKRQYGPWMMTAFRMLAALKSLRGTALDPFGFTEERKQERASIERFRALVLELAHELTDKNLKIAVELARLPQTERGFGHVKERNVQAAIGRRKELLDEFKAGASENLKAVAW
jgi:indolepyruvate ferredoxin oxidoreductase